MLRKYTEKSNIKVLVSKYVKEILEEDTKHFNIPKYDLCNRILIKFFLRTDTNFSRLTPFEEKEYLQFSLQKDNIPRYIELKKLMKDKTESEMIRDIFVSYTTLPPFLREINLFEEKIVFIMTAKKEYKRLKLYTDEVIIEGKKNSLKRNEINNYLEVEIDSKKYYISRVEIIN